MKRAKRFLSLLLALCLVFGLIPSTAFAVNNQHPFKDVAASAWYSDAVQYVYDHEMMNGTSSTTFSPDSATSRGMIVTILHRIAGLPDADSADFVDVPAGQWYTDAVAWASENGIVNGYGNGKFGPDDAITREQMATILYRYAEYQEYDTAITSSAADFPDKGQIGSYAVDAVNWALGIGLIQGTDKGTLDPIGGATRAQAATILMRFCKAFVYPVHTVTFDLNYHDAADPETVEVEDGQTVSAPVNPSRSGYTFGGWYTKANAGTKFDFTTAITEDLTLYARWTGASSGGGGGGGGSTTNYYTVTFNANGGTTSTSSTRVASGSSIGTLPIPTREGYTFLGWFTEESGGTEITDSTTVNSNMTVYAHWSTADDEIYTNIEDYFDDVGLTVLDTAAASASTSVQTEAEVKEFLEARGFGQIQIEEYSVGYPITYSELMDGTVVDETEVEGDSDTRHPLYSTFYLANSDTEDPVLWTIYVINGSVFAYPASFNTQTDSYKEVIVTENTDGSIISYLNGKYYNLSTNGESVVTKAVETIDVDALNAIDFATLCSLTGASRIDLFDASSVDGDTYEQATLAAAGARASQSVPEHYGEKFIAIALGDSYISGESISPYIGQYDSNGRAVSREDRVNDNDWMSHRSTASWPSRLSIPGIAGTLKDYYVPYHTKSNADIQWHFYAISGAKTENYATPNHEAKKDYTLPQDIYTPFLGRMTVEVKYDKKLPLENEVFNYIDDPDEIDYVFLSIGGNDANFGDIVADVVINSQTLNPVTWFGGDSKLVRDLNEVWDRRGTIINDIEKVIKDIHTKAPYATIIQTGYPKLYSDDGRGWTVTKNEAKLVNDKVSGFNDLIRERIESMDNDMDVRYVDIEQKFAGHSAYSHDNKAGVDGAWLNPFIAPARNDDLQQGVFGVYSAASMHPNEYGARAYAEAVNAVIREADGDRTGARSISGVITIADEDTDMTNNLPLAGANIKLDRYNPVQVGPNPSYSTVSDVNGAYRLSDVVPGRYNITVSKAGYLTVTGIVTISNEEGIYYSVTLEVISEDYTGTGVASGTVKDVLTGAGVSNLGLRVYPGVNSTEGEPVATGTTGAGGRYSFSLNAGNYTIEVIDNRSLDDKDTRYITNTFNIKILGGITIPNQDGFVTNGLAADQLRIVLKWGERPWDLDSHLVGPAVNGGRFHTYFSDRDYYGYSDDYSSYTLMANLDLDDVDSYGPETTTIYEMTPGIYTFLVYDFSNGGSSSSSALANSGAYVEVYLGASTSAAYTFYVPGGEGTLWTVFSYNSNTGVITPINTMSYHEFGSSAVGSSCPVREGDSSNGAEALMLASAMEDAKEIELKPYEMEKKIEP